MALGLVAAPVVPALAFTFPTFADAGSLIAFGALSVITLFFPLLVVILPRTGRPFLTSVVVGALIAMGPFGIIVAAASAGAGPFGAAEALIYLLAITAPLGAVGGAAFWFCALWRNRDFSPGTA